MRGGDGAVEHEPVARGEDTGRRADRDRRRPGLGPEPGPHGHADPGLGRADHLLQVPKGLAADQPENGPGPDARRSFGRRPSVVVVDDVAAAAASVHQAPQVRRRIVQAQASSQVDRLRHVDVCDSRR